MIARRRRLRSGRENGRTRKDDLFVGRDRSLQNARQGCQHPNLIESAFSMAETVTGRVKRWRDGDMRQRWCVAGLLDAETRFHRVQGHKQMNALIKSLDQAVHGSRLDAQRKRA